MGRFMKGKGEEKGGKKDEKKTEALGHDPET